MTALTRYHPNGGTPDGPDWIWVFGSNLAGRHGAGAALVAKVRFGAAAGQGVGITGRSYAVPTKDRNLAVLPMQVIARHVVQFLDHAGAQPEKLFYITRVGCGLAGYRDSQIAPMFALAPANCSMPAQWTPYDRLAKST